MNVRVLLETVPLEIALNVEIQVGLSAIVDGRWSVRDTWLYYLWLFILCAPQVATPCDKVTLAQGCGGRMCCIALFGRLVGSQ